MERKIKLPLKSLMAAILSLTSLLSCQKENTSLQSANAGDAGNLNVDSLSLKTLTLQPGASGQDAYVVYVNGDESSGDGNYNSQPELASIVWTIGGTPVYERSFIKFTNLSVIPANAKIGKATLYLSGITSSFNHPQGNSVYPGSPYLPDYPDNSCYVQQVTANWDESTITWNNQPETDTTGRAVIPSSTTQWDQSATVDVTSLVRKMVKLQKNYGFSIVQTNEDVYRSQQFAVSEDPLTSKRPKLVIKYAVQ